MLTRKYYKMIARVINNNTSDESVFIDRRDLINDLSIEFKADNHLFNRDKFINACDQIVRRNMQ